MASVQVAIVNRAIRLLSQTPAGKAPSSDESDAALTALNAMLDAWRLERLMCYAIRDESLVLVAAQPSFTIGPGGNLNTVRPIKIEGAYAVVGTQSYPVEVIGEDRYAALSIKGLQGQFPTKLYYQPSQPLGTLYPWPLAIDGSATLHILTRTPLAAVALADTLAVPPGWEDAMVSNLAVRLAPEYETRPADEVIVMARESKRAIKSGNSGPIIAFNELNGLFGNAQPYNIYSDSQ